MCVQNHGSNPIFMSESMNIKGTPLAIHIRSNNFLNKMAGPGVPTIEEVESNEDIQQTPPLNRE